jgi:integrase
MIYTAARRDELFRLQWSDVDLVNRRIRLGTRKRVGGAIEYDYVPLVQRAFDALSSLPKKHMLVFCHPDGKKYSQRQWFMRRLCAKAGVKPFGFHAIRHLSASILAHEGVPLPIVQGVLRHKNATTTSRYLRSLGLDLPALEKAFFAHCVQTEPSQQDSKVININSLKDQ